MSFQRDPKTDLVVTRHAGLVQRVKSVTGALCAAPTPTQRQGLLDELGTLNRILTDLVVKKKGRLRSPLGEQTQKRLHLVGDQGR